MYAKPPPPAGPRPFCPRLGNLRLRQPQHAALARPGVAADQHRAAFFAGVERQQLDLVAALVGLKTAARVGDMPAEMPDRALRLARRRRVDLGEQHHDVVRRFERRKAAPFLSRGARKLPRIEIDRGIGIGRVQMQMMEFRGRQHVSASSQRIWLLCAEHSEINADLGRHHGRRKSHFRAGAVLALAVCASRGARLSRTPHPPLKSTTMISAVS